MRKIVLAACVVSWCVGISFSTSGVRGSESVGAASEAKNVPGQIKVLKNSDVLAAVKARTPDAAIVSTFDRADCEFDISASGLLDLTKNGVSIDVFLSGEYPGDGLPKPVAFPDPPALPCEASVWLCCLSRA